MSGHSKWKTIQHKKGAADARRGKIFSKISRELMVVARKGGSNPDRNPALRTVIQKAKSANMPGDNVERAIKKGSGELEGTKFEEITYEGYAQGGVGFIVTLLTDNKNRTASEIKHLFTKHGASLAGQGSVSHGFERKGQIFVDSSAVEEEKLMNIVLEAGAEDMSRDGEQYEILTEPTRLAEVTEALEQEGVPAASAQVSLVPSTLVPVADKGAAASLLKFLAELEDNDDVQDVYSNMDIADDIFKELDSE
ncbi:MAG: YebC/PmpR family DNA-binding transcriptional regulator [Kiritimatiellia bacterium]